jgi:hypothetical protein
MIDRNNVAPFHVAGRSQLVFYDRAPLSSLAPLALSRQKYDAHCPTALSQPAARGDTGHNLSGLSSSELIRIFSKNIA